jgi:hypothetical protein
LEIKRLFYGGETLVGQGLKRRKYNDETINKLTSFMVLYDLQCIFGEWEQQLT